VEVFFNKKNMKITVTSAPPQLPELEEAVQKFWDEDQTFKKSVEQRPAEKSYVFYDGPPFATGMPHYGHLLASTTKDVIPRYWTMKGFRVDRTWGWDCHGLPIENMIEGSLGIKNGKKGIEELGIHNFNQACRSEVLRLDKEWERIIGRLGRWVDFEHNYKTMDTTYMESVWWAFQQLWQKGYVYEGKRVILYCPRCATPLSNFEIAMDNSYKDVTDPSNVYKYKVVGQDETYFLAWSTTPWNKIVTPAKEVRSIFWPKARSRC
jgi:isoleucyl-tRNA synthetase